MEEENTTALFPLLQALQLEFAIPQILNALLIR
jgi:hypothetical protein